jgi:hypothetical protein
MIADNELIARMVKKIISEVEVDKIIEKGEQPTTLDYGKARQFTLLVRSKCEALFEAMSVSVNITITAKES